MPIRTCNNCFNAICIYTLIKQSFQNCLHIPYSGFLSWGINNYERQYVAVLKSAVFNAPLLIVTWEIMKTTCHCVTVSLWDYFKWKGPLPDPKGSLARIISSVIPSGISVHVTNPIIPQDVSIVYWHHSSRLWPRKLDCLIVLISLCRGGFERLGLTIDA